MKVIGSSGEETVIVKMSDSELLKLAGFNSHSDFDKAFGCKSDMYYLRDNLPSLMSIEDIPVGYIFSEAKETLHSYEDLRSKFESIRNQLTTLMKKMVAAKPAPKEK